MLHTLFDEIQNIREKDPACGSLTEVLLTYPGFHAVLAHRLLHYVWITDFGLLDTIKKTLIKICAHIIRIITQIEIHPAAQIGSKFFIDHGSGVVIGETTIIGDNVTLYQGVTLGGVSTQKGKRHPSLGSNIVVGSGAKVLGNINIGDYVQVGANSVVLKDIPEYSTVVGIPGRIIKMSNEINFKNAINNLEHNKTPDYIGSLIEKLTNKVDELEQELTKLKSKESTL